MSLHVYKTRRSHNQRKSVKIARNSPQNQDDDQKLSILQQQMYKLQQINKKLVTTLKQQRTQLKKINISRESVNQLRKSAEFKKITKQLRQMKKEVFTLKQKEKELKGTIHQQEKIIRILQSNIEKVGRQDLQLYSLYYYR